MGVLNVISIVRTLHKDTVMIVDDYDKYYVYDKDCYVVYYLCKLMIKGNINKYIKNDINYLDYLVKVLDDNKVNYMVLIKRNGYNVLKNNFFLDNTYSKYCLKGKLFYKRMMEITKIKDKLRCSILDN